MSWSEIILISIALAMDAFAVSIASGAVLRKFHIRHALTMGAWFGGFQAIMPLIGWAGGVNLKRFITGIDYWIAFVLLVFLGGKMIYESLKLESVERPTNPFGMKVLLMLSVATSIDALAIGVVLAIRAVPILVPVIVIGSVTFIICFAGVCIGAAGKHFFEKKVEVIGGLVLIGIGIKMLFSGLLH